MKKQIINDSRRCMSCGVFMCMKNTKDTKMGFNWRCINTICNKYRTAVSLFNCSFFDEFNSKPRKIIKAVIHLLRGLSIRKISRIENINKNTLTKVKTAIDIRISLYLRQNKIKLGGPGVVVHVDETMLNHKVIELKDDLKLDRSRKSF
ncbi:hypothetical protein M153_1370007595 [Pseudoloma neurophilia]|uniref:Transposable element n=1 Tax=Pseudoloma neurophilia TaxID=146866 RepID=A0A0R0M5E7_9MICR|nr:hypothetical protein M153_1370007595 [Pseudoloma neurophilia]